MVAGWSTFLLFRTTVGFGVENPLIRVGFTPKDYAPDPIMPTTVDWSEPTKIVRTFPDIFVTERAARILFAVQEDFSINAEGVPDGALFEFETVCQGVQNFRMSISTGSGGIAIPGSWESFNPQPEPPANFVGMGFDVQFSANSPATVVIEAFDDGVEPFSFELIQAADFDADGDVDLHDLINWENSFGRSADGDANLDRRTNGLDFLILQRQFMANRNGPLAKPQAMPEPGTALLGGGLVALF